MTIRKSYDIYLDLLHLIYIIIYSNTQYILTIRGHKMNTSIKSKYPQIAAIWEKLLVNSEIDELTRGIIRCAYIRLILSEQKEERQ